MTIQVLYNYGGKPTGERRIVPDVYEDDDPAIFGLADYLVTNGHARRLSNPTKAVAPVAPESEPVTAFDDMTISELRQLAEANIVDLGGLTRKADIVAKLVEAGIEPPESGDEPKE